MGTEDWLVGRDRHSEAAERIYAAAADLMTRQGYDAFNIETLAAAVHCSPATIYRHALDVPQDEHSGEIWRGDEPGIPDKWHFSVDVARRWEAELARAPSNRVEEELARERRSARLLRKQLQEVLAERERLETDMKERERALESEVWRGMATNRDLSDAKKRLRELEAEIQRRTDEGDEG